MQPEQQQRIMGYFIEEAKDHLNTIEQGLLNLQSTIEDPEMVNELFRAAHSVKGGAAMLGLNSIQQVSHRMEDYFKILKESPVTIDQKLESLFLKVFDALQELLEQLQGPFGLTSDSANATIAGVEPTFVELEQHLNALVGSAPASLEVAAGNGVAAAQSSQQEVLIQVFGSEVPTQLREMLQLFKQPESDQFSREQLQTICRNLASLGEQFNLSAWCGLVEMARQAIAHPDNPYRTLAPVVIKDIKQAQDLVLAGRADAIAACPQLQELVPVSTTDADFADLLATANGIDLMAEPLVEDTEDDLLFAGLETSPATTEVGVSGLDFDLSDSFSEDITSDSNQRHGPEVGMAELNSLADLFEGEVPDLASTWQEEEIVGDAGDVFATDAGATTDDFDTAADFSDLLFDDDVAASQPTSSGEDNLSDLFGDALLDDDTANATTDDLFNLADGSTSGDDLDDLLAITTDDDLSNALSDQEIGLGEIGTPADMGDLGFAEDYPDLKADSAIDDGLSMLDLELETTSPLDNLGELFAGMDDTDLALTNAGDNLDQNLLSSEAHPLTDALEEMTASETSDELLFGDVLASTESADSGDSDDQFLVFAEQDESGMTDDFADFFQSDVGETTDASDLEALLTDDLSEAEVAMESDLGDLFDQEGAFSDHDNFGQENATEAIETLADQGDLDFGSMFDSSQPDLSDELDLSDTSGISELVSDELTTTTAAEDESWLTAVMAEESLERSPEVDFFDDDALETPAESLLFEDGSEDELALDAWSDAEDFSLETTPLTETFASDDLDLLLDGEALVETSAVGKELELDGADIFEVSSESEMPADELGFDLGELDLSQANGTTTDVLDLESGEFDFGQLDETTNDEFGLEDEFVLELDDSGLGAIATSESPLASTDLSGFDLTEPADGQSSDNPFADDLAAMLAADMTTDHAIDALDFELSEGLLSEEGLAEESLSGDLVDLANAPGMDLTDIGVEVTDATAGLLDLGDTSGEELAGLATESFDLSDDLFATDDVMGDEGSTTDVVITEAPFGLDNDLLELGSFDGDSTDQVTHDADGGLLDGNDDLFELGDLAITDVAAAEFDLEDLAAESTDMSAAIDAGDLSLDAMELTGLTVGTEVDLDVDAALFDDMALDLGSEDLGDLLDSAPTTAPNDFDDLNGLLEPGSDIPGMPDESSDLDALLEDSSSLAATNDLLDLDSLMDDEPVLAATDDLADLNDFLGEDTTAIDNFGELDDLLSESPASDSSEFAELDNLLSDDSSASDAFADLENLLDDTTPDELSLMGTAGVATTDDFADLEALLQGDESAQPTQPTPAADRDTSFDDLNEMLKAAQDVGGSPASTSMRRSPPLQGRSSRKTFEQTMRVPVKHLDNLSNLVGELVVNRNSLEQDQERLRQSLDNLLYQVQQLSDVGQRMQDLYERSLLESSLLASRQSHHRHHSPVHAKGDGATQTTSSPTGVEYDPLEMDRFTGFHSLSQEMIELIVRVRESASDIEFIVDETDQVTRMFRQVTTQLQEGLTRSRMVPFAQTADRLPRAVRDIAIKVGKQAELVIEGRETLIDKMILEQLYDPMTHLVNNAITHGIESPEVRRSLGKLPTGRIVIRAFHQGNQTIISVSDDGAGIDVERVKTKAIEKGLITPSEARSMSRLDMYDLLFHPGFSTKDQADDFSGRGVGMDVVRTSLSEIRGVINTDSTQGKGTSFTIRLPLTLSISKALCCISDRARIAFPMDGVEDMLDVPKDRIQTNTEGQPCLPWRDSLLPLRPLSELLGYNRHLSRGTVYGGNQEDDIASIVVLRSAGNFLALQVDQVLGEQEIVIKQLEGPVPKPVGVAGATVLGDGRIMPIADVLELIDLAMGRIRKDTGGSLWDQGATAIPQEPAVVKTEPMVLIVDDSITVRELLSMTFNKVGYRVEQARDGQEAWEKLRSGLPCDIVFCDIEMPRMDGLELLSRIQKDPNLTDLPIAMLTSRGADRHRQMASSLGASGYFTKPYLEEALLDAAQRMLKGEKLL